MSEGGFFMSNIFHTLPLTRLAGTLAAAVGAEAPTVSDPSLVPEILDLIRTKTGSDTVDRMLLYNPDAVGTWFYRKYSDMFSAVKAHTDIEVDYLTAYPPKTPVCFATMYTGAAPAVHGIRKYEKPVLTVDTLFDSLPRSGKRVAMVAVANQSIPRIFAKRDIDYYLMPYDGEVIEKALELIAEDRYDVIEVYNQEYDDVMHLTHPQSRRAFRAIEHYNESFDRLCKAVDKHWSAHDTLIAYATDHGTHRAFFGLGMHGSNIPKDMNITHFYGVKPKRID